MLFNGTRVKYHQIKYTKHTSRISYYYWGNSPILLQWVLIKIFLQFSNAPNVGDKSEKQYCFAAKYIKIRIQKL